MKFSKKRHACLCSMQHWRHFIYIFNMKTSSYIHNLPSSSYARKSYQVSVNIPKKYMKYKCFLVDYFTSSFCLLAAYIYCYTVTFARVCKSPLVTLLGNKKKFSFFFGIAAAESSVASVTVFHFFAFVSVVVFCFLIFYYGLGFTDSILYSFNGVSFFF